MQLRSGVAGAVTQATAAALIHPLAWELPHAAGVAVKKKKWGTPTFTKNVKYCKCRRFL